MIVDNAQALSVKIVLKDKGFDVNLVFVAKINDVDIIDAVNSYLATDIITGHYCRRESRCLGRWLLQVTKHNRLRRHNFEKTQLRLIVKAEVVPYNACSHIFVVGFHALIVHPVKGEPYSAPEPDPLPTNVKSILLMVASLLGILKPKSIKAHLQVQLM